MPIAEYLIEPATIADAAEVAALHTRSWQDAYRGMLPDTFLDGPIVQERLEVWRRRLSEEGDDRPFVIKAVAGDVIVGFACVLLREEPQWGPRLDNLHVTPGLKGLGIGSALFQTAHDWVRRTAPDEPMHLWVIEANRQARQFYDRRGGTAVERKMKEVTSGIRLPEIRYVWFKHTGC